MRHNVDADQTRIIPFRGNFYGRSYLFGFDLAQCRTNVGALACSVNMELSPTCGAGIDAFNYSNPVAKESGSTDRRNTAMNWLSSNWIWLALGAGALAFFAFGGGGCGMGHGSHDHRRREEGDQDARPRETTATPLSTPAARPTAVNRTPSPNDHVHGAPSVNEGALATQHAGHDNSPSQDTRRRHSRGC
jgi:hypothetical protein